jgi:phage protein D
MGASLAATSPVYTPSQPLVGSVARRPIVVVKIDGAEAPGAVNVRTTNVSHNAADTYKISFSLKALSLANPKWNSNGWGGNNPPQAIEVLYGLLDAQGNRSALTSAVIGPIDSIDIESPDNTVEVGGRDFSKSLIDTQTYENFTNQTASQIATTIAQRHGLAAVVQATTTPVGATDADTNTTTRNTRRESEWDLLTKLARDEGFVVYVRGKTLYFQPDSEPTGTPYKLVYKPANVDGTQQSGNMIKLRRSRTLTLAGSITVTVISHNRDTGAAVTATATLTANSGQPQTYTIDVPGLTQAQAQVRAKQLLKTYSLFERVIDIDMPGDPTLSFEQPIQLSGTNTGWDMTYFADQIEREMAMEHGFSMHIRAKNHSATAS